VVNGFTAAVATGDGRRACSYLTDLERKNLESGQGLGVFKCPEVFTNADGVNKEFFARLKISRVAQSGSKAVVSFEHVSDTMKLEKTGDKWKIAAIASI